MTQQEFGQLSTRLRGKLEALARRFTLTAGIGDEPEDIVQEAMVTLWELSEKGYPIQNAEALAVRLVKNRCVDHYRKRKVFFSPLEEGLQAGNPPVTGRPKNSIKSSLSSARRQMLEELKKIQG